MLNRFPDMWCSTSTSLSDWLGRWPPKSGSRCFVGRRAIRCTTSTTSSSKRVATIKALTMSTCSSWATHIAISKEKEDTFDEDDATLRQNGLLGRASLTPTGRLSLRRLRRNGPSVKSGVRARRRRKTPPGLEKKLILPSRLCYRWKPLDGGARHKAKWWRKVSVT